MTKSVGISDEANTYPFAGYKKRYSPDLSDRHADPKTTVLDIGFGTAVLTAKLYEQRLHHLRAGLLIQNDRTGVRKKCRAHIYIRAIFTQGLVEPLRNRRYDYIIATYALHHPTDAQKVVFLSALRGCLNENGKF